MITETKKAVTRQKIVYGMGRMARYVAYYIRSSQYLSSKEKERLLKQLQELVSALGDANARARGLNPPLPGEVTKQKREAERRRRAQQERLENP